MGVDSRQNDLEEGQVFVIRDCVCTWEVEVILGYISNSMPVLAT